MGYSKFRKIRFSFGEIAGVYMAGCATTGALEDFETAVNNLAEKIENSI